MLAANVRQIRFLALLLIADCTFGIAGAFAQLAECPTAFPVAEVEAGMQARAWTVAQGDTPEPFRVEILGVLRDGIALGLDMIIVEIADEPGSTMIARAGGIWAGMSGSPVYVGERLLGAIAWGFSVGPSRVGGVTPAEDMLEVLSIDETSSSWTSRSRSSVAVPASLRPLLAARAGLTQSQVATLESLPLAFAVSGLNAQRRAFVQDSLARAGISAIVTPTSSSSRQQGEITVRPVPGGNFAGLLSIGDASAGGVGTTTYVCGDRALAFGHHLRRLGTVSLSANQADAITIVTDPTLGPFKLANLGSTFGVLDEDRTAAVAATLGTPAPLVRIRSVVKAPQLERSRTGVSWTPSSRFVPDIALLHLLTNLDSVFDEEGDGRSRVEWRIKGRRANGEEWFLRRSNRYASRTHASFVSIVELFNQLTAIETNLFEDVTFKRVKLRAKIWTDFQAFHVESFTVTKEGVPVTGDDAIAVHPGDELIVRVGLRSEAGTPFSTSFALHVPAAALGTASISVFGGGGGIADSADDDDVCLFDHGECQDGGGDSFEGLLHELAEDPKNNHLTVRGSFDTSDEESNLSASRPFSRIVEGFLQTSINVVSPGT